MSESQRLSTRLSFRWRRKILIFFIGLFALGTWGLIDAVWAYPNRGHKSADFYLLQYMILLEETPGASLAGASVPDPATAFDALETKRGESGLTELEAAKYFWLQAVSRLHSLDAITAANAAPGDRVWNYPESPSRDARTTFNEARDMKGRLEARFLGVDPSNPPPPGQRPPMPEPPTPLDAYDLPLQWAIMVCGYLGAFIVFAGYLRARSRTYHYEPDTHTLHLPGGSTVTPQEIELVDKRKWDKFFVFVKTTDGREVKMDLLKYEPLEEWVLEMEKLSPNYEPDPEDGADESSEDASEDQPSSPSEEETVDPDETRPL